jgi:hypothetical protein
MSAPTATDVMLNALAAVCGCRTDLDMIHLGLRGLEIPPSATISDCWDQICADYLSGELEKRLNEPQPHE